MNKKAARQEEETVEHETMDKKATVNTNGYAVAKTYADVGLCVLPIKADGTKRPNLSLMGCAGWKNYQSQHPKDQQLKTWFIPCTGYGIVCGRISGDLEVIDFDDGSLFEPWSEYVKKYAVELYDTLVIERTPRGGYHVFYYCNDVEGNLKLAQKLNPETKKWDTLIETRGEGGFIVVAPTAAKYHNTGKPYERMQSDLLHIPTIYKEHRELLLNAARMFNEKVEVVREPESTGTPNIFGDLPGNIFTKETTWGEILEPHGWKQKETIKDTTYWQRPGKDSDGHSATTGHDGYDIFYVFSSNADPFEECRGYSKFAAYTLLNHKGNYEMAAAKLAKKQDKAEQARLPKLNAKDGNLDRVTRQAWKCQYKANKPESLFMQSGLPVRIEKDEQGHIVLRDLTPDRLRFQSAKSAYWYKPVISKDDGGNSVTVKHRAMPPTAVIRNMLASPDIKLPGLSGITSAPVFDHEGNLQTTPGYNENTMLCYISEVNIKTVPPEPSDELIARSKVIICDDLLGDFPFTGEADKANAIALMIQPAVREMIDGPTPMYGIDGTAIGSGKGLAAHCLLYPINGEQSSVSPMPRREEDLQKLITSSLRDGASAIMFDNVAHVINSSALAAALTADWWSDRILGKTEIIRLRIRCSWLVTGNNLTVSSEIARRLVHIRLDPKCERPWERTGFRHPNLKQWLKANRGEIVHAILVLVQNWVAKGMLPGNKVLGSYESWAGILSGILEVNGINGFIENLSSFYDAADTEMQVLHELVERWYEEFSNNSVSVKDLWSLIEPPEENIEPIELDLGDGNDRSRRTKFGKYISSLRDRVIGPYTVCQAKSERNAKRWMLLSAK